MTMSLVHQAPIAFTLHASAWLCAGMLLGSIHFITLRTNVRMLSDGRTLLPLGFQFLRFALLAVALTVITRWFGAMPLLAAVMGLLMARTAVVRRA